MPRQPRFCYTGAVLHIVQRGNNRAPVFASAHDRRFYLDCLRDALRTHDVAIHGYVLMTNHVHLLASPGHAEALPRMMQTVGRRYFASMSKPGPAGAQVVFQWDAPNRQRAEKSSLS